MAPSRAAFRRGLLACSSDERLAFLADLYEAQGWDVTRRGDTLSIRRSPDGETRTVRLVDESAVQDTDADVAVVLAKETGHTEVDGVSVVDCGDLYDRVRYGVEPEISDRLFATHFGQFPPSKSDDAAIGSSNGQPEDQAGDDGETTAPSPAPSRRTRRGLLLGAGALLGGMATVAGTLLFGRQSPVRAPGITRQGITEPDTLSTAHQSTIQTRSYSLELDHVRRDDDLAIRSAYGLDLALTADRAFFAIVSTDGPDAPLVLGEPPATSHFYSDGRRHFVDHAPDQDEGAVSFDPPRGFVGTWEYWAYLFVFGGTLGSNPKTYYGNVFEAIPTELVGVRREGGGDRYRLRATQPTLRSTTADIPGSDVRDVDLRVEVDELGLVRSFALDYRSTVDGSPARVSRRIEYTGVGETTVTRPAWAD